MATKRQIRVRLRQWAARVWFNSHTNETYFPAQWAGFKAGPDVTTSRQGVKPLAILRERAGQYYGGDYRDVYTLAELVDAIHQHANQGN